MTSKEKVQAGAILASMRKKEKKECPVCGKEFTALKSAVFCSNKCRQKNKYQKLKAKKASEGNN